MNFMFLVVVLFMDGTTDQRSYPYSTEAECQANYPQVVAAITDHNIKQPQKIVSFATTCLPLAKAPQGESV